MLRVRFLADNGLSCGIVLTWRPGSVCGISGINFQIIFSLDRANIQIGANSILAHLAPLYVRELLRDLL